MTAPPLQLNVDDGLLRLPAADHEFLHQLPLSLGRLAFFLGKKVHIAFERAVRFAVDACAAEGL